MINQIPPAITPQNKPNTTKTSIFYINDVHSNLPGLEKLANASVEFDQYTPSDVTKLKFSAGDIGAGRDKNVSQVATETQNLMGIMASAEGNHELDPSKKDVLNLLKIAKFKILGANTNIPQTNEENKSIDNKIISSYVQEQNNEKFGVIGLIPEDLLKHISNPKEYDDFQMKSKQETVSEVQQEIDKFKQQGINKVIVLSHNGYEKDVELAKSVEGIDVIIGGHSHDLLKGVEKDKNIFYSPKTGDPTIITQAGKDGKYYGVLNLDFNDKGVITSAQNNVNKTENLPKSLIVTNIIDRLLGKPEVLGTVKSSQKADLSLIAEIPSVNFLADAERSELGVDIAAINLGNIRSSLDEGTITTRDLQSITPFSNKIWIVKYTEKELVDAIKVGASSLTKADHTPGFLQFSGLKYTVSKSGEVKSVTFVDKDGNETPIDVKNPNPFKTYRVALDDFVAVAGNNYFQTDLEKVEQKFDFDKNKIVADYLKKHKEPIEIKNEGRIQIVD